MKVAIIGGGIGGLTLAWHLQRAGVAYDLFEAGTEPGGNFKTISTPEGYVLEAGPSTLQLSPELEKLLADLNLTDQIEDTAAVSNRRFVLRGGYYRELPGSPMKLFTGEFFSAGARFRLLREMIQGKGKNDPSETVGQFFRRRFGPEVVAYAVNPFVAGIYAGDPNELLLHKTFPQLAALEQAHGSVLRGLMKQGKAGMARRRIIGLRGGNQKLTTTLAAKLRHYHGGQSVTGLTRTADGRYLLQVESTGQPVADPAGYTHLALALPAYAAAPLLAGLFPAAAAALEAVRYPPMSVVFSAYRRQDVEHSMDGFGALHPKIEKAYAAGSVWTSSIFPARCPDGQVLFTTFVGGTQYEKAALDSVDDQEMRIHAELCRYYSVSNLPRWQGRYFWPRSIPQFDARIGPAQDAVDALRPEGVVAVANWRAGVGVPDVLRWAEKTAAELAK